MTETHTLEPLHALTAPLSEVQIALHQPHLQNLQGNILKGHGRDHSAHVFIRFRDGKQDAARTWVRDKLAPRLTTAWKQLADAEAFKRSGVDGGVFQVFFLSAAGMGYFQRLTLFTHEPFVQGQVARAPALGDTPDAWEDGLRDEAHAMLLIADDKPTNVELLVAELRAEVEEDAAASFADIVHVARGDQRRNARGDGIEHFGYVDGRSQPLLLERDFAGESDGTWRWDPSAGPALALVADPLAGDPSASGSYFVFRKLEQDVRKFKAQEQRLANALNLVGEARELAGAMVVGRFEDGTPVTLSDEPMIEGSATPNLAPNNFDYAADAAGLKCPFHAHIRKSNPRGSGPGGLVDENSHRMVRRGITYGERQDDGERLETMPGGGVGLLFMAYQADIEKQFEFIQKSWVNAPGFPLPGVGIDPVIGQPADGLQNWLGSWNDSTVPAVSFGFGGFVTTRGGAYLFAPSIAGLGAL